MQNNVAEHIRLVNEINLDQVKEIALLIKNRLIAGRKILIFGNGGSAADAQHFAAELVGRFVKERSALSAIALTTDSSIITAIANDYGYENIFSRQIEALALPGDVVIGITTSGNSKNVLNAIDTAMNIENVLTITLTGMSPNNAAILAKHSICINSNITARIQEMHIFILHLLAEKIEE